jgi:hypothetical protein
MVWRSGIQAFANQLLIDTMAVFRHMPTEKPYGTVALKISVISV